jgi:redox-sensitive bicupin YhaK (pirin superfamily)
MINIRRADDRGAADLGWLQAKHSFSFGSYHDPNHTGFETLRVINEDRIQPGKGFGTHGHKDMEIVTYMIDGALEHKDSMGNGSVIRRNEVQRMTAGSGVQHSEFNHSDEELAHLLQIWILPESEGLTPGYEEKVFGSPEKQNKLCLIASCDARDGSLKIHQDVDLYASILDSGRELEHRFVTGRKGWIQVVSGELVVNDNTLVAGDGAAVNDLDELRFLCVADTEFLLFDIA